MQPKSSQQGCSCLTLSYNAEMVEVVGEEDIAKDILDAARSSMGQDISPIDLINIETFARRVISMAEYRARLQVRCCALQARC